MIFFLSIGSFLIFFDYITYENSRYTFTDRTIQRNIFFCKVGQYIINFKSKTYPLIKQVKFFKERISKKKSSQNAVKDTAA